LRLSPTFGDSFVWVGGLYRRRQSHSRQTVKDPSTSEPEIEFTCTGLFAIMGLTWFESGMNATADLPSNSHHISRLDLGILAFVVWNMSSHIPGHLI
jgi:hypothetical protein